MRDSAPFRGSGFEISRGGQNIELNLLRHTMTGLHKRLTYTSAQGGGRGR